MANHNAVRAGQAYVEIFADNSEFQQTLRQTESEFRNWGQQMSAIGSSVAASFSMLPVLNAVNIFLKFDDSMRAVAATQGKTMATIKTNLDELQRRLVEIDASSVVRGQIEMEGLALEARRLGRELSFTSAEAAEAMVILARAGQKVREIKHTTEAVLDMARATGTSVPEAAQIAVGALNAFRLDASKARDVVDALTRTANASPQSLSDLGAALKYIGPVAQSTGVSLKETLRDLGLLAKFNIRGEQGGTSLRNMYMRMASELNQRKFKDAFGVDLIDDSTGRIKHLTDVLREAGDAIESKNLSQAKVANVFKEVFSLRALPAGFSLMATVKEAHEMEIALSNARSEAYNSRKVMDEGLGGSLRFLKSETEELGIALMKSLEEPLTLIADTINGVIKRINDFIGKHKAALALIAHTATTIGGVSLALGALAVVAGGVGRTLSGVMGAIRNFNKISFGKIEQFYQKVSGKTPIGVKNIEPPKIDLKPIDQARNATRYLQESLTDVAKITHRSITRFNNLARGFNQVYDKASRLAQSLVRLSFSVGLAHDALVQFNKKFQDAKAIYTVTRGKVNGLERAYRSIYSRVKQIVGQHDALATNIYNVVIQIETLRRSCRDVNADAARMAKNIGTLARSFKTISGDFNRATENFHAATSRVGKTLLSIAKNLLNVSSGLNRTVRGFKNFQNAAQQLASSLSSNQSVYQTINEQLTLYGRTLNGVVGEMNVFKTETVQTQAAVDKLNRAFASVVGIRTLATKLAQVSRAIRYLHKHNQEIDGSIRLMGDAFAYAATATIPYQAALTRIVALHGALIKQVQGSTKVLKENSAVVKAPKSDALSDIVGDKKKTPFQQTLENAKSFIATAKDKQDSQVRQAAKTPSVPGVPYDQTDEGRKYVARSEAKAERGELKNLRGRNEVWKKLIDKQEQRAANEYRIRSLQGALATGALTTVQEKDAKGNVVVRDQQADASAEIARLVKENEKLNGEISSLAKRGGIAGGSFVKGLKEELDRIFDARKRLQGILSDKNISDEKRSGVQRELDRLKTRSEEIRGQINAAVDPSIGVYAEGKRATDQYIVSELNKASQAHGSESQKYEKRRHELNGFANNDKLDFTSVKDEKLQQNEKRTEEVKRQADTIWETESQKIDDWREEQLSNAAVRRRALESVKDGSANKYKVDGVNLATWSDSNRDTYVQARMQSGKSREEAEKMFVTGQRRAASGLIKNTDFVADDQAAVNRVYTTKARQLDDDHTAAYLRADYESKAAEFKIDKKFDRQVRHALIEENNHRFLGQQATSLALEHRTGRDSIINYDTLISQDEKAIQKTQSRIDKLERRKAEAMKGIVDSRDKKLTGVGADEHRRKFATEAVKHGEVGALNDLYGAGIGRNTTARFDQWSESNKQNYIAAQMATGKTEEQARARFESGQKNAVNRLLGDKYASGFSKIYQGSVQDEFTQREHNIRKAFDPKIQNEQTKLEALESERQKHTNQKTSAQKAAWDALIPKPPVAPPLNPSDVAKAEEGLRKRAEKRRKTFELIDKLEKELVDNTEEIKRLSNKPTPEKTDASASQSLDRIRDEWRSARHEVRGRAMMMRDAIDDDVYVKAEERLGRYEPPKDGVYRPTIETFSLDEDQYLEEEAAKIKADPNNWYSVPVLKTMESPEDVNRPEKVSVKTDYKNAINFIDEWEKLQLTKIDQDYQESLARINGADDRRLEQLTQRNNIIQQSLATLATSLGNPITDVSSEPKINEIARSRLGDHLEQYNKKTAKIQRGIQHVESNFAKQIDAASAQGKAQLDALDKELKQKTDAYLRTIPSGLRTAADFAVANTQARRLINYDDRKKQIEGATSDEVKRLSDKRDSVVQDLQDNVAARNQVSAVMANEYAASSAAPGVALTDREKAALATEKYNEFMNGRSFSDLNSKEQDAARLLAQSEREAYADANMQGYDRELQWNEEEKQAKRQKSQVNWYDVAQKHADTEKANVERLNAQSEVDRLRSEHEQKIQNAKQKGASRREIKAANLVFESSPEYVQAIDRLTTATIDYEDRLSELNAATQNARDFDTQNAGSSADRTSARRNIRQAEIDFAAAESQENEIKKQVAETESKIAATKESIANKQGIIDELDVAKDASENKLREFDEKELRGEELSDDDQKERRRTKDKLKSIETARSTVVEQMAAEETVLAEQNREKGKLQSVAQQVAQVKADANARLDKAQEEGRRAGLGLRDSLPGLSANPKARQMLTNSATVRSSARKQLNETVSAPFKKIVEPIKSFRKRVKENNASLKGLDKATRKQVRANNLATIMSRLATISLGGLGSMAASAAAAIGSILAMSGIGIVIAAVMSALTAFGSWFISWVKNNPDERFNKYKDKTDEAMEGVEDSSDKMTAREENLKAIKELSQQKFLTVENQKELESRKSELYKMGFASKDELDKIAKVEEFVDEDGVKQRRVVYDEAAAFEKSVSMNAVAKENIEKTLEMAFGALGDEHLRKEMFAMAEGDYDVIEENGRKIRKENLDDDKGKIDQALETRVRGANRLQTSVADARKALQAASDHGIAIDASIKETEYYKQMKSMYDSGNGSDVEHTDESLQVHDEVGALLKEIDAAIAVGANGGDKTRHKNMNDFRSGVDSQLEEFETWKEQIDSGAMDAEGLTDAYNTKIQYFNRGFKTLAQTRESASNKDEIDNGRQYAVGRMRELESRYANFSERMVESYEQARYSRSAPNVIKAFKTQAEDLKQAREEATFIENAYGAADFAARRAQAGNNQEALAQIDREEEVAKAEAKTRADIFFQEQEDKIKGDARLQVDQAVLEIYGQSSQGFDYQTQEMALKAKTQTAAVDNYVLGSMYAYDRETKILEEQHRKSVEKTGGDSEESKRLEKEIIARTSERQAYKTSIETQAKDRKKQIEERSKRDYEKAFDRQFAGRFSETDQQLNQFLDALTANSDALEDYNRAVDMSDMSDEEKKDKKADGKKHANEERERLSRERDKQSRQALTSHESGAFGQFTVDEKGIEFAQQERTKQLQDMIDAEQAIIDKFGADSEEGKAALERMAETSLFKTMADEFYEFKKKMEKAEKKLSLDRFMAEMGTETGKLEGVSSHEFDAKKKNLEIDKQVYDANKEFDKQIKEAEAEYSRLLEAGDVEAAVGKYKEVEQLKQRKTDLNTNAERVKNQNLVDAQSKGARETFEKNKKEQDSVVFGSEVRSSQADIQIAAIESMKTGGMFEEYDKMVDRQANRVRYSKAVSDYESAQSRAGVLNSQAQEAYKIWQDSIKNGASSDEVQENFEKYKSLWQESNSAQKGLQEALGSARQARLDVIKGEFERKESFSTGTFSAFEAMDSHNDWQKENTIKQTEFLKKICENTELGLWS